jgi:ribonuclease BN (tRNA processing enzyme)
LIDRVYISHLHSDHAGGLEWLAFCTKFNTKLKRPILHAVSDLMPELWYSTLRGGLESLQGEVAELSTFFEPHAIRPNAEFRWGGLAFQPVQTVHVVSGYKISHSYGLMMDFISRLDMTKPQEVRRVFYTSDTQFCPKQIETFYDQADLIFQDCETSEFPSGVHAHYNDLRTLSDWIKKKMWLMHYQPDKVTDEQAKEDGFLGFVKKGQFFIFGD